MQKTFDDPYGRHALVERFELDDNGFERDVLRLVGGFHPTRIREGYQPRHAK